MTRILLVGAGNMGSAMLRGLCSNDFDVYVLERHKERHNILRETISKKLNFLDTMQADSKKITFDAICICTKPGDLQPLKNILKPWIVSSSPVVLSILAGVTTDDIKEGLDYNGPVVRAMPNIAALVGAAATAICPCDVVDSKNAARTIAEKVFSSIGEVYWTTEKQLDAVTGLSGSGPAYVYMFIESLIDGAVKAGMPRDLAAKLATQTVLGASMMVKETGEHPAVLKDKVTTPGGTTIYALHEMESQGFRSILMNAVGTATNQSALLGARARSKQG